MERKDTWGENTWKPLQVLIASLIVRGKQQTGIASLISLTDTDLSHTKLTHPKFHKDLADLDRWMKEPVYVFPRCTIFLKARCEKGCMLPHMLTRWLIFLWNTILTASGIFCSHLSIDFYKGCRKFQIFALCSPRNLILYWKLTIIL